MAEEQQDGQKTLVAFVVGLLIGGMLVWAFSGPDADAPTIESDDNDSDKEQVIESGDKEVVDANEDVEAKGVSETDVVAALQVGKGSVSVPDQKASMSIELDSVTYPVSEGWIGVRQYTNDNLGYILGVVRFSESQGLVPAEIALQRSTTAGKKYAVVIFTEDGDRDFSLSGDVQIDTVFDTFVAE